MPAHRKSHTKSRKGCLQCKAKHSKCSETRPRCTNCTRLEIECTWPYPLSAAESDPCHASAATSPASGSPASSCLVPPLLATCVHPSLGSSPRLKLSYPSVPLGHVISDLGLLHHWTLNTALTFTYQDYQLYLWQNNLVELGFKHHYLLHIILAVAALHKAVTYPTEQVELLTQSSHHMNAVLREFPSLLEHPDPSTCVPMFATSCLLTVYKMGEVQVTETDDLISRFCEWSRLSKGCSVVVLPNWTRLGTSEFGMLLYNARGDCPATGEVWEILKLRDLVDKHMVETEPGWKQACLDAIRELHEIFLQAMDSTARQSMVPTVQSWLSRVSDLYINLLSQKDPVAMIILAHYAVLVRAHKCWWTRSWNTRLISAIETFLPSVYHEWLHWPKTYRFQRREPLARNGTLHKYCRQ